MTNAKLETIQSLNKFLANLEKNSVFENDYFKLLSEEEWSPTTYEFFRANFFYRTELTVKGIANTCARSAAENDMDTLILFSYILGEETGMGEKARCHEIFMEKALNLFGSVEYGLPELRVQEAKNSSLILPETIAYREKIHELITGDYPRMLGVMMALETHADIMLTAFRNAFRLSRNKLDKERYLNQVEIYFNSHIDNGVEERHAEDATKCVVNNCSSKEDYDEIVYGALEAFKVQESMWQAMYQRSLTFEGLENSEA